MKLVFDENYPSKNRAEYQRLFDFIQIREKLTDIDATVKLMPVTPDNLLNGKNGVDILFLLMKGVGGGTRATGIGSQSSDMFVDDLNPDRLETFAHEMIHASDHAHGRLKDAPGGGSTWLGEYVDKPYRERPWEIRAFAEAPKIMKEYSQWLRETATTSDLKFTPSPELWSLPNTPSPLNTPLRRQSVNLGQDTSF